MVLRWLADRRETMLGLLAELVNIDSGSYDKAGVDAVGARIEAFFKEEGIACERIANATYGDALRAAVGGPGNRPVLLMGHRDTVFPNGEAKRRPFRMANGRAFGPGVADMKAGLVMNAFVLVALARMAGSAGPLVALFTADEEIGSPSSRRLIEREASAARAVFNSEPGRPSGAVVTGRKGGVFMRLALTGRAAHSGANFEHGISAIEELARKIIALHALTGLADGVTVNVGLVSGGQTVNTVAPHAAAEIDLRFLLPADRATAMARIEDIVATPHLAGTTAALEIAGEFLPLVQSAESEALFSGYRDAASEIGLDIKGEFTGGCADSGFAAMTGTPTLCGTGPVGARAHTPEEYLDVESVVPRAQALALAILRLHA
jgi:glutamate carboxypeptidase